MTQLKGKFNKICKPPLDFLCFRFAYSQLKGVYTETVFNEKLYINYLDDSKDIEYLCLSPFKSDDFIFKIVCYYKKSIFLFWENLISLLLPINYFVDSGQFLEKAYKRQYSHSGSYH